VAQARVIDKIIIRQSYHLKIILSYRSTPCGGEHPASTPDHHPSHNSIIFYNILNPYLQTSLAKIPQRLSSSLAPTHSLFVCTILHLPHNMSSQNNMTSNALTDAIQASVTYTCGDCNANVELKKGQAVRCGSCGHRVLYKKRTNQ